MTQVNNPNDDMKFSLLELAFNDARDNLRFAESKAAFIAVVLTIAVTALPAIPNVKEIVSFGAFKSTVRMFLGMEENKLAPFESLLLAVSQGAVIIAICLCMLAVITAIRAAVPVNNPTAKLDLSTPAGTNEPRTEIFYPTGFSRNITPLELITRPRKDIKFNPSFSNHMLIRNSLSKDEILDILGNQIIRLGYIRDLKMQRVAFALKCVLFAIIFLISAVILYAFRHLLYR